VTPLKLTTLEVDDSLWQRVFTVAPLVVVGTREPGANYDLAPKHLVAPMWGPYFSFVCSPDHATYRNAQRERAFTVSWPRPSQVVLASLAASPRCRDGEKTALQALPTFPAVSIDGVLLRDGYFFLECRLERVIDGFGRNSLVVGQVCAAHADPDALRTLDREDDALVHAQPLLAYLHPGRFASVDRSQGFPFPAGFTR
jgi:flavin reductase (DIM6/NTAB) family NADH-FMN oxidoreductase RutF